MKNTKIYISSNIPDVRVSLLKSKLQSYGFPVISILNQRFNPETYTNTSVDIVSSIRESDIFLFWYTKSNEASFNFFEAGIAFNRLKTVVIFGDDISDFRLRLFIAQRFNLNDPISIATHFEINYT